jgi:hypothetical protein
MVRDNVVPGSKYDNRPDIVPTAIGRIDGLALKPWKVAGFSEGSRRTRESEDAASGAEIGEARSLDAFEGVGVGLNDRIATRDTGLEHLGVVERIPGLLARDRQEALPGHFHGRNSPVGSMS